MSSKVTIHRLGTGVPGLDQILGGGLPEFSFNLITTRYPTSKEFSAGYRRDRE